MTDALAIKDEDKNDNDLCNAAGQKGIGWSAAATGKPGGKSKRQRRKERREQKALDNPRPPKAAAASGKPELTEAEKVKKREERKARKKEARAKNRADNLGSALINKQESPRAYQKYPALYQRYLTHNQTLKNVLDYAIRT